MSMGGVFIIECPCQGGIYYCHQDNMYYAYSCEGRGVSKSHIVCVYADGSTHNGWGVSKSHIMCVYADGSTHNGWGVSKSHIVCVYANGSTHNGSGSLI